MTCIFCGWIWTELSPRIRGRGPESCSMLQNPYIYDVWLARFPPKSAHSISEFDIHFKPRLLHGCVSQLPWPKMAIPPLTSPIPFASTLIASAAVLRSLEAQKHSHWLLSRHIHADVVESAACHPAAVSVMTDTRAFDAFPMLENRRSMRMKRSAQTIVCGIFEQICSMLAKVERENRICTCWEVLSGEPTWRYTLYG